jgi:hypothetical protein
MYLTGDLDFAQKLPGHAQIKEISISQTRFFPEPKIFRDDSSQ